jgi:uncharacterized protein
VFLERKAMNNFKIKMENKLLKSEFKLSSVKQGSTISKLVIQISHTCNLQCPYCCSDKGLYGKNSAQLMSSQIISDSLELFARLFDGIKSIYLFGGEPTLNLKGIRQYARNLIH